MFRIQSTKRKNITILAIALVLLIAGGYWISSYIRYQREKGPVVQACQKYLNFYSNPMPADLLNYSEAQLEAYLDQYWSEIQSQYPVIFSPDVAETVQALETERKIIDQVLNRQLLITEENYTIDQIIRMKISQDHVTIVFHTTWAFTDLLYDQEKKAWQAKEHTGETYYKLALIRSNDQWLVQNVAWNPFAASFGW